MNSLHNVITTTHRRTEQQVHNEVDTPKFKLTQ